MPEVTASGEQLLALHSTFAREVSEQEAVGKAARTLCKKAFP